MRMMLLNANGASYAKVGVKLCFINSINGIRRNFGHIRSIARNIMLALRLFR